MKVTVADILRVPSLREACVLAGKRGLGRHVRWVHPSDILDVSTWLYGGEIVLTTSRQLLTPDLAGAYIRALAQARVAGVISAESVNRTPDIVNEMIAAGDSLHLPIVTVPASVPFVDVTREISHFLISREREHLEMWEYAAHSLTSALIQHKGIGGLVRAVSRLFSAPVLLLSPQLDVRCAANEGRRDRAWFTPLSIERIEPKGSPPGDAGTDGAPRYLATVIPTGCNPPCDVYLYPLTAGTALVGYLGVFAGSEIASDALLRYSLELMSLELSWEEREKEIRGLVQRKLVESILKAPEISQHELQVRLKLVGFDLDAHYVVLAALPQLDDELAAWPPAARPAMREASRALHPESIVLDSESDWLLFVPLSPSTTIEHVQQKAEQLVRHVRRVTGTSITIGSSLPGGRGSNIRESVEQARRAASIGVSLHGTGTVVPFGALGPYQLFRGAERDIKPDELAGFIERQLATIERFDTEHGAHLVDTLRAYFDNFGNAHRTAEQLYIHRNTLHKRLKTVERLTGLKLERPEERLGLELALRLSTMRREADSAAG